MTNEVEPLFYPVPANLGRQIIDKFQDISPADGLLEAVICDPFDDEKIDEFRERIHDAMEAIGIRLSDEAKRNIKQYIVSTLPYIRKHAGYRNRIIELLDTGHTSTAKGEKLSDLIPAKQSLLMEGMSEVMRQYELELERIHILNQSNTTNALSDTTEIDVFIVSSQMQIIRDQEIRLKELKKIYTIDCRVPQFLYKAEVTLRNGNPEQILQFGENSHTVYTEFKRQLAALYTQFTNVRKGVIDTLHTQFMGQIQELKSRFPTLDASTCEIELNPSTLRYIRIHLNCTARFDIGTFSDIKTVLQKTVRQFGFMGQYNCVDQNSWTTLSFSIEGDEADIILWEVENLKNMKQ